MKNEQLFNQSVIKFGNKWYRIAQQKRQGFSVPEAVFVDSNGLIALRKEDAEVSEPRAAAPAAEPKAKLVPPTAMVKCGECLYNKIEIVDLVDGICPKCGADYRISVSAS